MRAAIVDDEQKERENLKLFIERFSNEEGHPGIETELFPSGDAFLQADSEKYDIVLFDIDMPGINGMDTARRIRAKNSRITILFVTNVAAYAINGYEVDAVDYILKPVSYFDFSAKFGKAVRRAQKQAVQAVMLDTSEGLQKIRIPEVRYIEVMGHYVIWHLDRGNLKVRATMRDTTEMLRNFQFCQVHKSYLVNLARVENIGNTEVTAAGESVPVGRKYREQLLQSFMKFMREQ